MTDIERQRRLHVTNRLEELRARHGRDLEAQALPDWLDTYEAFLGQRRGLDQPARAATVAGVTPPVVKPSPVPQKADFSDLDV